MLKIKGKESLIWSRTDDSQFVQIMRTNTVNTTMTAHLYQKWSLTTNMLMIQSIRLKID